MSGGGNNRAQQQAQAEEQRRQAQIKQTVGAVNAIYDAPEREAAIQDFIGAYREQASRDVERQQADANRQDKFALARMGQVGGSLQADRATRSGELFTDAMLNVERGAQGAGQDIRSGDQQQRLNLVGLANSGLDTTTATQQALAGTRNDLQANMPTTFASGLSDVFGEFADMQQYSRQEAARKRADDAYGASNYKSPFRGGN